MTQWQQTRSLARMNRSIVQGILLVGLVVGSAPTDARAPRDTPKPGPIDLAPNGSFEKANGTRPEGWAQAIVAGKPAFSYGVGPNGTKCVCVRSDDATAKGSWITSPPIDVVGGDTLTVRVKMKLEDVRVGHGGDGARLTFHSYAGKKLVDFRQSDARTGTTDWIEFEHRYRVPANADRTLVSLRLSRATGAVWFDDVRVFGRRPARRKAEPAPTRVPGTRGRVALIQTGANREYEMMLCHFRHEKTGVDWFSESNLAEFPEDAAKLQGYTAIVCAATKFRSVSLSAKQMGAIRAYVNAGGGLVTMAAALARTPLADLLPVEPGRSHKLVHFVPEPARPDHPILRDIPVKWPGFGSKWNAFVETVLRPRAQSLMTIPEAVAPSGTSFLSAWQYGKGRVVAFNSIWHSSTGNEFKRWRYAPRFFAQAARWAAGLKPMRSEEKIPPPSWAQALDYGGAYLGELDVATLPNWLRDKIAKQPKRPQTKAVLVLDEREPIAPAIVAQRGACAVREGSDSLEIDFPNGFHMTYLKEGGLSLKTDEGLPLTSPPARELPLVAASGTEPLRLFENVGAETVNVQSEIPKARLLIKSMRYKTHRIDGSEIVVSNEVETFDGRKAELHWRFVPRTININGKTWRGIGDSITFVDDAHYVESITPRYRWAIGGTTEGHFAFRLACYSSPRGYWEGKFDRNRLVRSGRWSFLTSGQPFELLGAKQGSLLTYFETPENITGELIRHPKNDWVYINNRINVGRRRGRIETPIQWHLFSKQPLTHNLWLEAYKHVKDAYCRRYDIEPTHPVPTAMMRIDTIGDSVYWGRNAEIKPVGYEEFGKALIPLAAERGFRRVDIGHVASVEVNPASQKARGGLPALKRLTDLAHRLGVEAYHYVRIAIYNKNLPLLKEHPEWIVRNKDGSIYCGSFPGMAALSMKGGWYDYALGFNRRIRRETGLDGVWFDTINFGFDPFDYKEAESSSMAPYGIRYLRDFRKLGFGFWVEGINPFGLDSFWYRHDRYKGDFPGREFCLWDTSMFAYGGDSVAYLDHYRLAAYYATLFVDIRLMRDADNPLVQRIIRCNRVFNEALDRLGNVKLVKETEFGTMWIGERGYAIFTFEPRKIEIRGLKGNYRVTLPLGRGRLESRTADDGTTVISGELWAEDTALILRVPE